MNLRRRKNIPFYFSIYANWVQSFTSLRAILRQVINGVWAFSRCLLIESILQESAPLRSHIEEIFH